MKKLFFAAALGLFGWMAATGTLHADEALRRIQQSLRDQGFYYGPIDGTTGDETTHAIQRYQIRNGLAVTGQLNLETISSINRTGAAVAKSTGSNGNTISGDSPRGAASSSADEDRRYAQGNTDSAPGRATPAPTYRTPPGRPAPDDGEDDAPVNRDPAARPDLRAGPPSSADLAGPPRNGVAPSAVLTAAFARSPFEFAPPPVQADILRRAQAILLHDGFYDGEANGRPNPVTFEALTNFQGFNHLPRSGRFDVETLARMGLLPNRRPLPPRGAYYDGRGSYPVYDGRAMQ